MNAHSLCLNLNPNANPYPEPLTNPKPQPERTNTHTHTHTHTHLHELFTTQEYRLGTGVRVRKVGKDAGHRELWVGCLVCRFDSTWVVPEPALSAIGGAGLHWLGIDILLSLDRLRGAFSLSLCVSLSQYNTFMYRNPLSIFLYV